MTDAEYNKRLTKINKKWRQKWNTTATIGEGLDPEDVHATIVSCIQYSVDLIPDDSVPFGINATPSRLVYLKHQAQARLDYNNTGGLPERDFQHLLALIDISLAWQKEVNTLTQK